MTDDLGALEILESLRRTPERSAAAEQAGLRAFVREARVLRGAVSPLPAPRHTGWKLNFNKKEISPMTIFATLLLATALAVGGTGATVYAAQDSLPNQPLYSVKLATEQTRLAWAVDPSDQVDLLLTFTQTRVREMARLIEQNQDIPEQATARLQTQLQLMLQAAAQLRDAEMTAALARIQQIASVQQQMLAQLRLAAPDNANWDLAEQAMTQTRTMVELGVNDPTQFRHQLQLGAPEVTPAGNGYGPGPQATPVYSATQSNGGNGYGAGPSTPCRDCTPKQDGNNYGPGPQATPVYSATQSSGGNGYGPGPSTPCGDCTPEQDGNSYGPGPGNPSVTPSDDNNGYGGPQPTGTPQPGDDGGNGAGPGPQPSSTCTPAQDGSGGPSVTPPGEGNGGGPQPTGTPGQHGQP